MYFLFVCFFIVLFFVCLFVCVFVYLFYNCYCLKKDRGEKKGNMAKSNLKAIQLRQTFIFCGLLKLVAVKTAIDFKVAIDSKIAWLIAWFCR